MTRQAPIKEQYARSLQVEPNDIAVMPPEAPKYVLAPEDRVEGTQNLTREDLQIPQLIVVQAQSKNVPDVIKHIGQLYNALTGEFHEEVNAVLLSEAKGRVCFSRDYDGESDPLCGSDDALTPRPEYYGGMVIDPKLNISQEIAPDLTCAACPLSRFGPQGEPPMCAKSYSYAMIDAETGIPFVMRASRTATSAAKQLNTIAKTLGRRKYIKIATRSVESDKGNYCVPVFSTNGDTESDLKAFAFNYSNDVGNIAQRAALTEGVATKQLAAPPENPELPAEELEIPF